MEKDIKKIVETAPELIEEHDKIKGFLITKYGDSFVEEGDSIIWTDKKDNNVTLIVDFYYKDSVVMAPTGVIYVNNELEKLWQSKIKEGGE